MNKKTASLLLICLVALAIVYGCSGTVLSSHAAQSLDVVASEPTTVTEPTCQNAKMFYPLGDPIDDPVPHRH